MKQLTFAILFTVIAFASYAQGPNTQATQTTSKSLEQRAEELTAGMAKNLRLTAAQVKKVQSINLLSMQQVEDARLKYKTDPKQFAQQMDVISQTRLSQIKDVLTPQQFAQYQQRREEKMGVPKEAQSNPSRSTQEQSYQNQY
ncbi:hypothetical protein [Pontibacter sp. SGAir0037]|uniref:hypothetical protein n=1 Tax=Pontibacter sp. SGAir0037 TaxID=2571030 RepID=UPI0010CCB8D9|nr:hypothetical protein [Pontibacter sp. SGAir0037]QCR22954.1 hypothetical protein C1N53_11775 [Pontibacter sp. SGAir0037]